MARPSNGIKKSRPRRNCRVDYEIQRSFSSFLIKKRDDSINIRNGVQPSLYISEQVIRVIAKRVVSLTSLSARCQVK